MEHAVWHFSAGREVLGGGGKTVGAVGWQQPLPSVCCAPYPRPVESLERGPQGSLLSMRGQVQQQEAGSEHVDHYPGLSGKGLCARALYDYQAGNVRRPGHSHCRAPRQEAGIGGSCGGTGG